MNREQRCQADWQVASLVSSPYTWGQPGAKPPDSGCLPDGTTRSSARFSFSRQHDALSATMFGLKAPLYYLPGKLLPFRLGLRSGFLFFSSLTLSPCLHSKDLKCVPMRFPPALLRGSIRLAVLCGVIWIMRKTERKRGYRRSVLKCVSRLAELPLCRGRASHDAVRKKRRKKKRERNREREKRRGKGMGIRVE